MSLKEYSTEGTLLHVRTHTHTHTHKHTTYTQTHTHTHTHTLSISMDVDLDGDKGRQLLRILIQMVIVKHPPLAADALNLLIRHFSQRKEMVHGFRQVSVDNFFLKTRYSFIPYYTL